ncbi:hypothetical protein SDC9_164474 [bioreactor metagenome]|uniref:Uncharacterized protein n=1 Tax=bioreactor metagenome TaxID=1076179 RepID=A0A645FZ26_9ZZZZ
MRVKFATKFALEDIGEHLSPKYAPAIIAPEAIFKLIFPALAIKINATPTVLTVPNDVPKRKDTTQLIIKAYRIKKLGFMYFIP